jgi:putative ABC transport system ATP-binding protein
MLRSREQVATAIRLEGVGKTYGKGRSAVEALRDVNVDFPEHSFTAVMGPSGSGKSTMIQCAAGLDTPSSGTVYLGDVKLNKLKEPKLTTTRRDQIGFIFQSFNLLPSLNAYQNIILPLKLAGKTPDKQWVQQVIDDVGLSQQMKQRPAELSGGQQQRVAIARALVTRPQVIFADEPTGALDTRTGRDILTLLRRTVDELGQTVIMVTHDPVAASFADRVFFLKDGRLVDELRRPTVDQVAERLIRLEP